MANPPPNPKDLPSAIKHYRIRQQLSLLVRKNSWDNTYVSEVASSSSWTRGSVMSSFIDGELGSTFGRWMRGAGRLVIDPIDTFIGMREFGKLYAYVTRLDAVGWQRFTSSFDAEAYAPRIAEVLRHRVYPRKLQVLAQKITLQFTIFGKVRFERVISRIHFHTKEEFEESIADLCTTSLNWLPKSMLLLHIPVAEDTEDFLSRMRHEISHSSDKCKLPQDMSLLYRLIDQTRELGAKLPKNDGEKEVEMLRIVLGEEHPDTLKAMHNLAVTHHKQYRWTEAEKLQVVVLEKRRRVLGEEHLDTLETIHNLAVTYHEQRRWTEAERLQVVVLEKRRRVLGEEHPDTLEATNNLAVTYYEQCRWTEAEELEVDVLKKRGHSLGEEHPDTLKAIQNLALTYHEQHRWTEAEKLIVVVLEKSRQVLAEDDPDTLETMHNLAVIYHEQRRWTEAEKLKTFILEKRRRVLGEGHRDTVSAMQSLAVTYHEQRRWTEAEKLTMVVLEKRKQVLGEEDPDTLETMSNLAVIYYKQRRRTEAEELTAVILEKRRQVLGKEHPDTLKVMQSLAVIYHQQEQ